MTGICPGEPAHDGESIVDGSLALKGFISPSPDHVGKAGYSPSLCVALQACKKHCLAFAINSKFFHASILMVHEYSPP